MVDLDQTIFKLTYSKEQYCSGAVSFSDNGTDLMIANIISH